MATKRRSLRRWFVEGATRRMLAKTGSGWHTETRARAAAEIGFWLVVVAVVGLVLGFAVSFGVSEEAGDLVFFIVIVVDLCLGSAFLGIAWCEVDDKRG